MRIEGVLFLGISTPGESVSLERKIESSIFLCIPRDLNILGKSCTTFMIVKIVRNLSRGRSPCQRVNHVKTGVIYFSAFIFSYDTIHVYGTIHTWNRGLTKASILFKSSVYNFDCKKHEHNSFICLNFYRLLLEWVSPS